jgi:hypothetical protein
MIATNKATLSEAEEFVDFLIATIRNRNAATETGVAGGLGWIALCPSTFYTHFLFLDEYNFGGIQLERRGPLEEDNIIEDLIVYKEQQAGMATLIVSSVVSGWSMKNYLAATNKATLSEAENAAREIGVAGLGPIALLRHQSSTAILFLSISRVKLCGVHIADVSHFVQHGMGVVNE